MERGQPNDIGSWGSFVYFAEQGFTAVTRAILAVHPPPDAGWGTNRSKWKTGSWHVRGRIEIPLEQIVRERSMIRAPSRCSRGRQGSSGR